jgi:hypothetical protein
VVYILQLPTSAAGSLEEVRENDGENGGQGGEFQYCCEAETGGTNSSR